MTIQEFEMIRMDELVQLLKVSEATIRRWRRLPDDPFPEPVDLGPQAKAYIRIEVLAWLERRASQRRSA